MLINSLGVMLAITAFVQAQPDIAVPAAHAASGGPICMAAAAKGEAAGRAFTILVDAEQASTMATKGYSARPCGAKESAALGRYHSEMCRVASRTPFQFQEHFRDVYGASPAELCSRSSAAVDTAAVPASPEDVGQK